MLIKYFLVACFLFFSGNVFSNTCDVDKDYIYNVFKEYRISLYDELVNPVRWFSGEFNKEYIEKIKNSSPKERTASLNLYDFNLQAGKQVKIIHGYDVKCESKDKVDLNIYAFSYLVKTKAKMKKNKPTKVTVKYVKEGSGWLIKEFIFDNRKDSVKGIDTSVIIDEFTD